MIVEIGTYQGRSIIAMALDAGTPLFGVDPHVTSDGDPFVFGDPDRDALMRNLVNAGVASKVRLLDMQSAYAAKGWLGHAIGLLYLDGDHSAKGVRADLKGWLPHVVEGGYVAFHDSDLPGVQAAIVERDDLNFLQTVGGIALYAHRMPPSAPMTYGVPIQVTERKPRPARKATK
jgi:predicted O-methyltransferase YrrM